MKLFRLDRTDPLSFGPKFPEILVEGIAPVVLLKTPVGGWVLPDKAIGKVPLDGVAFSRLD